MEIVELSRSTIPRQKSGWTSWARTTPIDSGKTHEEMTGAIGLVPARRLHQKKWGPQPFSLIQPTLRQRWLQHSVTTMTRSGTAIYSNESSMHSLKLMSLPRDESPTTRKGVTRSHCISTFWTNHSARSRQNC